MIKPIEQAEKYAKWILTQAKYDEKTGTLIVPEFHRSQFGLCIEMFKAEREAKK